MRLVDEDTRAFNQVIRRWGCRKGPPTRRPPGRRRSTQANRGAIAVPFRVMQVAAASFDLLEAMAKSGNPASVSDAGVGALCARAAVRGAWLNVRINLPGLADRASADNMVSEGEQLVRACEERERAILGVVEGKLK